MEENNSKKSTKGIGRESVDKTTEGKRGEILLKIAIQKALTTIQSSVPRNHADWYRLEEMKEEIRREENLAVLAKKREILSNIFTKEIARESEKYASSGIEASEKAPG